jgi:hypothetical protein
LLRDQRAAEIDAPLDCEVRPRFEVLREDFREDHLLGEVLGANDDAVLAPPGAGDEEEKD